MTHNERSSHMIVLFRISHCYLAIPSFDVLLPRGLCFEKSV